MRELTVVAGSFVGFQLLFSVASPLLSSATTPGYGRLPPTKLTEWNSRLVSTVHALIVGLFCLYILWFDDAVNANPVWGDPGLVKLNVAITCGYLLYDLVLLACNWSTMGDSFFCLSPLGGAVCIWICSDTWRASLLCQLSSHLRVIHTVCEPKVVL